MYTGLKKKTHPPLVAVVTYISYGHKVICALRGVKLRVHRMHRNFGSHLIHNDFRCPGLKWTYFNFTGTIHSMICSSLVPLIHVNIHESTCSNLKKLYLSTESFQFSIFPIPWDLILFKSLDSASLSQSQASLILYEANKPTQYPYFVTVLQWQQRDSP